MRDGLIKLLFLAGLFPVMFGCRLTHQPDIKPPTAKEVYVLPPEEQRYRDYPTYPKDVFDDSTQKKKDRDAVGGGFNGPGPGRPGSMSGY
jgi:hypothetical protein